MRPGIEFPVGGDRTSLPGAEHDSDLYLECLKEEPGKYDVIKPVEMEGMEGEYSD